MASAAVLGWLARHTSGLTGKSKLSSSVYAAARSGVKTAGIVK
jgi:hypothetical protein